AAEAVEILIALIIPDMRTLAFYQGQRLLVISSDGGEEKLFMFANGFGRCGFRFNATHFRSFGLRMPRSLQIFSIRTSLISLCLGMEDRLFNVGLCHHE